MSTCLKGGYGTLQPLMRKTEPDFSQATFSASALFVWAGAVASLQWCLYAAACVRYECLKGGFDSSPLLVCELSRAARNSVRHSDIQSIGFTALTRESQCDEVRPGPINALRPSSATAEIPTTGRLSGTVCKTGFTLGLLSVSATSG